MDKRLSRQFLRAPLLTEMLYEDEGHVLKAKIQNISEGGILLAGLPRPPAVNLLPMMIDLPIFPDFQGTSVLRLKNLRPENIEREICRVRGKLIRTFKKADELEEMMLAHMACEFVAPSEVFILQVQNYVTTYSRNIVYLLGLFESISHKEKNIEIIRHLASLMGYRVTDSIALLRQKIMHDYQSLESL